MPDSDRGDRSTSGTGAHDLVLEHFVPYRLSVLANTVSRTIAAEYQARFGLSIPEWRVMAVLGRYAPLSASGICERTAMDKVRVSRAVSRLLGFIESDHYGDDAEMAELLELTRTNTANFADHRAITALDLS